MKKAGVPRDLALTSARRTEDLLRIGLLASAFLATLGPIYQFIGSMIRFHRYRGDFQVFWAVTRLPIDQIYDYRVFAYPPTAMLLFEPFGRLPFWASLLAWSITGAAGLSCAATRLMRPLAIGLGFFTYAGLGVLLGGQVGLIVAALIIAALGAAEPRFQGLLLAIGVAIKPQSLLAAPIVLVAQRNWKAVAWCAVGVGGLFLLSVVFFGADIWVRWLIELPKFHTYLVERGLDQTDVGLYGLARSLALPGWTFLFGIPLGILTTWLMFRREAPPLDRYAAFATSTVLMSPYTLYYDLAGLTFTCMALLLDRKRSPMIWLAAAMIVSSFLTNIGIVLLAAKLSVDALRRPVICLPIMVAAT